MSLNSPQAFPESLPLPHVRPPWRSAAVLAGVYLIAAGIYIVASSRAAGSHTRSVEEFERVEILKGLTFVAVTAFALFLLNAYQLSRRQLQEDHLRRLEQALHHADRSIMAGTFASTVAHDINNGLAAATLALSELEEAPGSESARTLVRDAQEAINRIAEWNRRFFELGSARPLGERRSFDLAASLHAATTLAGRHRALRDGEFSVDLPAYAPFHGIESILQRAVLNLLLNAAEASGAAPRIRLALEGLDDHRYLIVVEDSGPGVRPELRDAILEPFFTTKPEGTGLGLASVLAAAQLHDGRVEIGDSSFGGARFRLEVGPVRSSAGTGREVSAPVTLGRQMGE